MSQEGSGSRKCKAEEFNAGKVFSVTDCVTIHSVVTKLSPVKKSTKKSLLAR